MADKVIKVAGRKVRVIYSDDSQLSFQGGGLYGTDENGEWDGTIIVYSGLPPDEQRRVISRELTKVLWLDSNYKDMEEMELRLDRYLEGKGFEKRRFFHRKRGPK